MHFTLSIVGLTFLAVQCRSQAVRETDRQYSAIPSQYQQIDQENLRQERQLQQLSRRQDRRISQDYRYQYEPESSYSAETQYQPSFSDTPNRIITRPRQVKPHQQQQQQQPIVEQYLKEVTPTTKTTYDPNTYQPAGNAQAQSAIEYFLHPEQQKRPFIQQPRYELSESPKEGEVPQNVLAYQNALIAHQNAIYEQQRADQLQKQQQDSSSKASFYASQNIQKKPVLKKLVKPKTSTLDEEIDYLTSLQYQQQQIQQQQVQQQNKVYEAKQAPPAKYQARIPQYSKPELLATEEEQGQVYQPQIQYTAPTRFAKPYKSPKLQAVYQPEYQQEIRYQPLGDSQPTKFQQFDPAQYEQYIQYQPQPQHHTQSQPQPQPTYSAGPKYLPEQKLVRYQEPVAEKYQPQSDIPSEEALQKYRASIAKYYSTDGSKPSRPRQQVKPQYVQEEQHQQRYQAQQYEQPAQHQPQPQAQQQPQSQHQPQPQQQSQQIYQGPTDEEYKQSEFKQSLGLNSSLRILKSGKPVVFIGHEE